VTYNELLEKVRELEAKERRLASLLELGQRFMADRDPLTRVRHVCDTVREMTQAGLAGVVLVSEDLQRIERLEIAGLDDARIDEFRRTLQIDDTIRRVLKTRQPARGHSFLITPVASPSRVFGWFMLAEKSGAASFSDSDELIAMTIGTQIGMAYETRTLRDNEDDMEFAMSIARVGVSYRDLESPNIGLSRSLASLLELPQGATSISRDDFFARVHPDDVERVRERVADAVARGSEFELLEYRLRTPAGGWRWFRSNGRVTSNRPGQPTRLFSGIADVTESRTLEAQLYQSQKMDALGQLAGGIAHDFNNLLTAIGGYANFLLESVAEAEARADVEAIIKAAGRAGSLTKQLLAFSSRQIRTTVLVDINVLVQDMAAMLRRMIRENIELSTKLAIEPVCVEADRSHLEQVVMNLVLNAKDAIDDAGSIRIETAGVELENTWSPQGVAVKAGKYVMVAVSDSGRGMTEDTKARLFEPFFTTKSRDKGTGLGLATVYGIVSQNGGSIWVESERGRGATFKVYLPRHPEPAPAPAPAVGVFSPKGGTETILLVEDEPAVLVLARTILERAGYRVIEAANPAIAESQWSSAGAIDLLLTDVVMPGGTGPELFNRLSDRQAGLRVLFMSGYAEGDLFDRANVARPGAFLEKPFTAAELVARVREALDR
jgi:signal transduction histidine kinase